MRITKEEIFTGLRELGLMPGDSALTHSSLSSFGHVEGGADAVIDAIIEAVSPGGTVLFPTLTGSEKLSPKDPPIFDVRNTPCWTGKIPETARNRPEFIRSAHPTHSVCARGPKAEHFTQDHEFSSSPCGVGSPYDKLVKEGGYILLIGVSHQSNTTMHYVEEVGESPWHLQADAAFSTVKYPDGRVKRIQVVLHKYGTPRNFNRFDKEFLAEGIQVNGKIGGSMIRLVRDKEMVEFVLARLKDNPEALLRK